MTSVEQTALSQEEIRSGLREALHISTDTSVHQASAVDGYLGNAAIKNRCPK